MTMMMIASAAAATTPDSKQNNVEQGSERTTSKSSSDDCSFAGYEDEDDDDTEHTESSLPDLPTIIFGNNSMAGFGSNSYSSDLAIIGQQQLASPSVVDVSEDISLGSGRSEHRRLTRTRSGRDSLRDLYKMQDSARSLMSQDSSIGTASDPLKGSSHQRFTDNNPRSTLLKSRSRRGLARWRAKIRQQVKNSDARAALVAAKDVAATWTLGGPATIVM
jgi:hypothetical protein